MHSYYVHRQLSCKWKQIFTVVISRPASTTSPFSGQHDKRRALLAFYCYRGRTPAIWGVNSNYRTHSLSRSQSHLHRHLPQWEWHFLEISVASKKINVFNGKFQKRNPLCVSLQLYLICVWTALRWVDSLLTNMIGWQPWQGGTLLINIQPPWHTLALLQHHTSNLQFSCQQDMNSWT